MKKIIFKIFALAFVILLLNSCGDPKKTEGGDVVKPVKVLPPTSPLFSKDSAYSYIAKQVEFGPRVPNTVQHRACGDYLISFFKQHGALVYVQEFEAIAYNGTKLKLRNIIASYNPQAQKRVILCAHWDTRPYADQDLQDVMKPIDGANDGGSGVGILMEIGRVMHTAQKKPNIGVDIILFDGEDYGKPSFAVSSTGEDAWCLGSEYWSKNKHIPNYSAFYGILLDMVGARGARFAKEQGSVENASSVVDKVWDNASKLGYGNYFVNSGSPMIIDDHVNMNKIAKIPTIDIIQYSGRDDQYFGDYWHTHNDNMNVIDRETLNAVGQTLLEVVYTE